MIETIIALIVIIFAFIAFTVCFIDILDDTMEEKPKFNAFMMKHNTFFKICHISLYIPVLNCIFGMILITYLATPCIFSTSRKIIDKYWK